MEFKCVICNKEIVGDDYDGDILEHYSLDIHKDCVETLDELEKYIRAYYIDCLQIKPTDTFVRHVVKNILRRDGEFDWNLERIERQVRILINSHVVGYIDYVMDDELAMEIY